MWEPWLALYVSADVLVILLALSFLFSLGGYVLWSWFDRHERVLQSMPTESYLALFAWPVASLAFSVVFGAGLAWLFSERPLTGIAVLAVGAVGAIGAGLRAARLWYAAQRNGPTPPRDNPTAIRQAQVQLEQTSGEELTRTKAQLLDTDYQKLVDRIAELPQRRPDDGLLRWSFQVMRGYTWLVTIAGMTAAALAGAASVAAVVDGESWFRAASLGATLLALAAALWWRGMRLRAETQNARVDALAKQVEQARRAHQKSSGLGLVLPRSSDWQ